MSAQPVEPDPRPAEVLHITPQIPGQTVPPGVVTVPPAEYDRIRRRAIAQQIRERTERFDQGDFSDFQQVTSEEKAAGELNRRRGVPCGGADPTAVMGGRDAV